MLHEFGRAIWIADGSEAVVAGFRYPTRMAVMKLADGSLFIWSPIHLTDVLKTAVDAEPNVQPVGPVTQARQNVPKPERILAARDGHQNPVVALSPRSRVFSVDLALDLRTTHPLPSPQQRKHPALLGTPARTVLTERCSTEVIAAGLIRDRRR